MKILAIATTLVFLCCLEVALSYPAQPAKPQEFLHAYLQEKHPSIIAGRPRDNSRAYLSESTATIQKKSKFHNGPNVSIVQRFTVSPPGGRCYKEKGCEGWSGYTDDVRICIIGEYYLSLTYYDEYLHTTVCVDIVYQLLQ